MNPKVRKIYDELFRARTRRTQIAGNSAICLSFLFLRDILLFLRHIRCKLRLIGGMANRHPNSDLSKMTVSKRENTGETINDKSEVHSPVSLKRLSSSL